MRIGRNNTTTGSKKKPRKYLRHNYRCGANGRYGKFICTSCHIRTMTDLVFEDEEAACQQFLASKEQINSRQTAEEERLRDGKHRLAELETLIPSIYEDKVLGKIPEGS